MLNIFFHLPESEDDIFPNTEEEDVVRLIKQLLDFIDFIKEKERNFKVLYSAENINTFESKAKTIVDPDTYLKKPITTLRYKLNRTKSENWDKKNLHSKKGCLYILWLLTTTEVSVLNGKSLAEIAERKLLNPEVVYLFYNLTPQFEQRAFIPIIKDCKHLKECPIFVKIDYVQNLNEFELWFYTNHYKFLIDKAKFYPTSYKVQGARVYQELSTKYYWYLDNFHKNHYEVFSKDGKHLGVADLDGTLDTSKKVNGRLISL